VRNLGLAAVAPLCAVQAQLCAIQMPGDY